MLDTKKLVKIVSVAVASMSLLGVSASVTEAASFTALAEVAPTNPAIKKGDKIFVTIKDTKNQKVAVLNANGTKTAKTVSMGSTFIAKDVKKTNGKNLVKISGNQWLNTKDVVKD